MPTKNLNYILYNGKYYKQFFAILIEVSLIMWKCIFPPKGGTAWCLMTQCWSGILKYIYQKYSPSLPVEMSEKVRKDQNCLSLLLSHLSQVQYKTVSLVETLPADRNLRRPDDTSTCDLQQPLNVHVIGHHVLETWGHAPFLCERKWCHQCQRQYFHLTEQVSEWWLFLQRRSLSRHKQCFLSLLKYK